MPLRPDGIRSGGASGGLAEIRRSGTGCWPVPDNVRALLQGEDDGDFKGGAAGGKEFHGDDVPVAVLNGVLFNEIPLGNGRFIGGVPPENVTGIGAVAAGILYRAVRGAIEAGAQLVEVQVRLAAGGRHGGQESHLGCGIVQADSADLHAPPAWVPGPPLFSG